MLLINKYDIYKYQYHHITMAPLRLEIESYDMNDNHHDHTFTLTSVSTNANSNINTDNCNVFHAKCFECGKRYYSYVSELVKFNCISELKCELSKSIGHIHIWKLVNGTKYMCVSDRFNPVNVEDTSSSIEYCTQTLSEKTLLR